jgi:glycosyltransferase involved in cell wall biosynthesis
MSSTAELSPNAAKRRVRACMLAYTFYENDGRVIRYAEALAGSGVEVDAIVLRRQGTAAQESMNGVRVLRIQEREKNERGKFTYFFRVMRFFLRSMIEITRRHAQAPYDIVHVHSVPDFEVFAAIVPKLMGAKVVLDIHDIVPEFYAAKFKVSERSLVFEALKWIERLSAAFADHVIIANDLWRQKVTARSCATWKCSALINYPDPRIFNTTLRNRRADGKFVVIYPGTLNYHRSGHRHSSVRTCGPARARHAVPYLWRRRCSRVARQADRRSATWRLRLPQPAATAAADRNGHEQRRPRGGTQAQRCLRW